MLEALRPMVLTLFPIIEEIVATAVDRVVTFTVPAFRVPVLIVFVEIVLPSNCPMPHVIRLEVAKVEAVACPVTFIVE